MTEHANQPPRGIGRRLLLGGAAGAAGALAAGSVPAAAENARTATDAGCHPTMTPPRYRGEVPGPVEVIGADFDERIFTLAETWRYLEAVRRSSDRVITAGLGRSWRGAELRYAVVGEPRNVTPRALAALSARLRRLRDPRCSGAALARALRGPAVAWLGAGVHGNEPAGTNAALRVLRDLADRTDCAANEVLANTVVVILPVQNPDGYATSGRNNGFGFDINREWFAATQLEMREKLRLLQELPPQLFMDLHEMSGAGYFFPPYADPVHHEIPSGLTQRIAEYSRQIGTEFRRIGADYFTGREFDLLYPGFADAGLQLSTLSASMTFEKGQDTSVAERVSEHRAAAWVSLSALAANRQRHLRAWHDLHTEAYRQGAAGTLEPNTRSGGRPPTAPAVPDVPVRHYFLLDDPAKRFELDRLLHRLQLGGVRVHRLTAALTVPDFRRYGERPGRGTLPAGTYWVPLAQPGKHWAQAMLGERSYPSTQVFTDVGSWALPLLANVAGGWSGARLSPAAQTMAPLDDPEPGATHPAPRAIAVLRLDADAAPAGSYGWTLHQLENVWRYPYRVLTPAEVSPAALADVEVLLVPDGPAQQAAEQLGAKGAEAIASWVRGGGRFVGWRSVVSLAAQLGLTKAGFVVPKAEIPGAFLRTIVDTANPLADGVGETAWQFYFYDSVLYPAKPEHALLRYPAADSARWYVAGFALGAEELAGGAAAVDEPFGEGNVVLFGAEPNFRASADGTARILRNTLSSTARAAASYRGTDAGEASRHREVLPGPTLRVVVRAADAARAGEALRPLATQWTRQPARDRVAFVLGNPDARPAEHHSLARSLPGVLRAHGVEPLVIALT